MHASLTKHFDDWYATPPIYAADELHNGDWSATMAYFDAFYTDVQHTSVRKHLCKLIYRAIHHTPRIDESSARLQIAFSSSPTYADFREHVRTLPNSSSPGMLGCSYNMIKSWPESALEAAHGCLSKFWDNKHIPDHWKWRWLTPIPKNPRTHLSWTTCDRSCSPKPPGRYGQR